MFRDAPEDIINTLNNSPVTYNYHKFCFLENTLKKVGLLRNWTITSTSRDLKGVEFVATIESNDFPFYGVQFHPEKNQFEFKKDANICHNKEAIKVSQYFANFFVEECRNSVCVEVDSQELIYRHSPCYKGNVAGSAYEQLYIFE